MEIGKERCGRELDKIKELIIAAIGTEMRLTSMPNLQYLFF
jgi:hypothetical protein